MRYASYKRFWGKHPDDSVDIRVCALCIKGSRVLSVGFNTTKTDPLMAEIVKEYNVECMYDNSEKEYLSVCRHAEVDALKKLPYESQIDSIVVIRLLKDGSMGLAKPCNICSSYIKERGVSKVFYTDYDGWGSYEV